MREYLKKENLRALFFLIIGCIIGSYISNISLEHRESETIRSFQPVRANNNNYQFINPVLFYKVPSSALLPEYEPLADAIQAKIKDLKESGRADSISVYYRDMNEARWVGMEQSKKYSPASLLKIVVMMVYMKQSEIDSSAMKRWITYSKDIETVASQAVPYSQKSELSLGQAYTIENLIGRMIINSDNGATYALLSKINEEALHQLYMDLGLNDPAGQKDYKISAQEYSFFFRVLYNATYLNKETSEQALAILAKTTFMEGIAGGLPPSVIASHKYGESVGADSQGISSVELHDCGIVYASTKPYFLCVMTQGSDLEGLKEVIKEVSGVVYRYVIKTP